MKAGNKNVFLWCLSCLQNLPTFSSTLQGSIYMRIAPNKCPLLYFWFKVHTILNKVIRFELDISQMYSRWNHKYSNPNFWRQRLHSRQRCIIKFLQKMSARPPTPHICSIILYNKLVYHHTVQSKWRLKFDNIFANTWTFWANSLCICG
jgi:hypothetical protein